jgi:TonB family protein
VQVPASGYAVTLSFDVDSTGAAKNLSILGNPSGNVAVAGAAERAVEGSHWPPATSGTYRGANTVHFLPGETNDLIKNLSAAASEGADRAATAPPESAPTGPSHVVWDRGPTQADYERFYPKRALERTMAGDVELSCVISEAGKLDCKVSKESPGGWGFGPAALQMSKLFRAGPRMDDGRPSASEVLTLPITFRATSQ